MTPRSLILPLAMLLGCPPKPAPTNPLETTDPVATEPVAPAVDPTASMTPRERLAEGIRLLKLGDDASIASATTLLESVVAAEPDNVVAQVNLGVAHHLAGQLSDARASYERATDLDPAAGEPWFLLGLAQLDSGRDELALATWRTGMRRDPTHPGLRTALVQALREQGELDEAIAEAKAALRVNSNNLSLYNNLGLAYLAKGDVPLAKFVFRKGIDSGGERDAWLHTNLGRAFLVEGDRVTSQFYLEKAVELDPRGVPGLVYLSGLYLDDHNYGDAVPLLERALEEDPANRGAMLNLGIAYRGVSRFDDAERLYRQALEALPSDPGPLFNLAVLYGDYLKDYDRAIATFREYISQRGERSDLATVYVEELEKEQRRAQRQRRSEEDARRRDQERAERERLLREEEANPPTPTPETPSPEPTSPEPTSPGPTSPDLPSPEPSAPDSPTPEPTPWGEPQ
jgi:tetratricopeptide (TPR) repeat protein